MPRSRPIPSYSKFNKVAVAPGAGQAWKFNAANRGVPFKNTNLQKQFGNVGARNLQGGQQIGTQLGKGAQGIQGVQRVQSGKNVQGMKTSKTTHIQNNKTIQSNKTIKSNKTVQTNKNIQGNRVQGVKTSNRVQPAGGGNKGGGNKNAGKLKKHP